MGLQMDPKSDRKRIPKRVFETRTGSDYPETRTGNSNSNSFVELEVELDLKFDERVRVRVSSSSFWVIASGSSFEYPFWDPFSVTFRVHLETHLRSLWGPIFESIWVPIWGPKMTTWRSKSIISIACGIARGNEGFAPPWNIAQSPSHSLSHPSDGFATTPARGASAQCELP